MRLVKNFLLNGSYQLLLVMLPLITAPYISRTLDPQGIGLNTYTGTITQYFVLFAVLGTSVYGNREIAYHQNDKMARSKIFWGINFLSWITSCLVISAFLFFTLFIHQYQELYLLQGIAILGAMFDISWYFIGMEKFKIIATRNFIFKILSVIAIFAFVHQAGDLPLYIMISTAGNLLGNLSLWLYMKKEVFPPKFKSFNLKHHLHYTVILFLPTIAVQIYTVANKNMIGVFDSVVHAGFFDQSNMAISMPLAIITSIGVVMMPRVAHMYSEENTKAIRELIEKTFNIVTGISAAIFFGILGIALKFAPFFFGKPFATVGIIMMLEAPVIIFIPFGIVFGNQYLLPLNRMKPFTLSACLGAIVSILLNHVVIPIFGVFGATVVYVISQFVVTAYRYYAIRHEFRLSDLFKGTWKYFLSGFIMFIVVFLMDQHFEMNILQLLLQVTLGIIIYGTLNILLKTGLWKVSQNLIQQFLNKRDKSSRTP